MIYAKRLSKIYVDLESLSAELNEASKRCRVQAEGCDTEVSRILCEAQADAIDAFNFYLTNSNPFKED